MRSIKFRAWDGKYKKMHLKVVVGNLHDEENYTANALYLKPGDTDYKIEPPGQWMNFDEHSDIVLMQFTGLTDKNSKEIYEGDVVRIDWNDSRYEPCIGYVEWDYKNAAFSFGFGTTGEVSWSHEVIGNIYENPELIS